MKPTQNRNKIYSDQQDVEVVAYRTLLIAAVHKDRDEKALYSPILYIRYVAASSGISSTPAVKLLFVMSSEFIDLLPSILNLNKTDWISDNHVDTADFFLSNQK